MNTKQKALLAATVAVLGGVGIYEARQAANARAEVSMLQQKQGPLAELAEQLRHERDNATNQLAALDQSNGRLNRNIGEVLRLRAEVTRLKSTTQPPGPNTGPAILDTSNPLWKPNWVALTPIDLAQFPDSQRIIRGKSAKDVGIATPAALLETWIWAQRTGDSAGLLKTWSFPDGTTEEQKMQQVVAVQRRAEYVRQHPDTVSETTKLRDLFELREGYYLAFLEQTGPATGTHVGYQFFHHVGDEWKVGTDR
jgi:hypothetical protein